MIKLEFHGAASTVTGSNFLVRTDHANFVVDCGMFQGEDVEARNLEEFKYDASKIDFVLLTHAHIDHSGMLPKLYKAGFRPIFATYNTVQISELLLLDSAKIQENNYKVGDSYGKYTKEVAIVFNAYDAEETIRQFRVVDYDEEFAPVEGIKVKFIKAGHVLGAASIEVDIIDGADEKKILFSGDIGRESEAFIDSFDKNYQCDPDYILMESLYGGVEHPDRQVSIDRLLQLTNETIERGGSVFIPSFAVQRTQDVLHYFKEAKDTGVIDKDLEVYLDSPLAQKVSHIYTSALEDRGISIFNFDKLVYVNRYKLSQKISRKKGIVVVAGSGMADGGRIMDHLAGNLGNKKNSVIFVGYQAEGTLGRELVDGAKEVTIGKTKVKVEAQIVHLHGFSAHGDSSDYLAWIERFKSDKLKNVFMIHAEEDRTELMKEKLKSIGINNAHMPSWHEAIELT